MDEPDKVYQLKDKAGSVRLYVDDEENCYAQGNPDMELTPIETQVEMNDYCQKYSRKEKRLRRSIRRFISMDFSILFIIARFGSVMRCRKELTRYGMYPRTCLARAIGWMAFQG